MKARSRLTRLLFRVRALDVAIIVSLVLGAGAFGYDAFAGTVPSDPVVAPIPTMPPFDAAHDVTIVPFTAHYPGAKQGSQHGDSALVLSGFAMTGGKTFAIIRQGDADENLYPQNALIGSVRLKALHVSSGSVTLSNGDVLHVTQDIGSVIASPSPGADPSQNPNPYSTPPAGGN